MCAVAYPCRLVKAKLKATREALESLNESMMLGAPPEILSYDEVCYDVGFNKYWERRERYKFNEDGLITPVHDIAVNGHENGVSGS